MQIEFLEKAKRDLREIEDYLVQFYPSTARKFNDKLEEKLFLLVDFPYMYPEYEEDSYFRKMVFGDYLLFYTVEETNDLIIIGRIIHSSRDIKSIDF